jgi:type I restriction enzyme S subunit
LATNQGFKNFIPKDRVDRDFLYYLLISQKRAFIELCSGSTFLEIGKRQLAGYTVRIPQTKDEQQAIAAALSDADGVVAGLERVIAKKRLIKQGAMQDLLTARRRLPGFSGEWEVTRLGDHVRFLKNGTHSRGEMSEHGPVKNLHYGDIHGATSIFLSPAARMMPTLDHVSAGRLDRLVKGDLVFVDASEDLAGVGTSVEITDLGQAEAVAGLHTIAARFDKSVFVDGFKAFLQFMPEFRSHLCKLAAGTKVLATSRCHIASAEIALPPPDEQKAIAAVLRDMDAEIQTLEARLAKARAVKEGMMQNLLTGRVRLV